MGEGMGSVVLGGMTQISSMINKWTESGAIDDMAKGLGNAFTAVSYGMVQLIPFVEKIATTVKDISTSQEWADLWGEIGQVIQMIGQTYLEDVDTRLKAIKEHLPRIKEWVGLLPGVWQRFNNAIARAREIVTGVVGWVVKLYGEFNKRGGIEGAIKLWAKFNAWMFRIMETMSKAKTGLLILVSVVLGFMGPLGWLADIIFMIPMAMASWGESAALQKMREGFTSLSDGVKSFAEWIDTLMAKGSKLYNFLSGIVNAVSLAGQAISLGLEAIFHPRVGASEAHRKKFRDTWDAFKKSLGGTFAELPEEGEGPVGKLIQSAEAEVKKYAPGALDAFQKFAKKWADYKQGMMEGVKETPDDKWLPWREKYGAEAEYQRRSIDITRAEAEAFRSASDIKRKYFSSGRDITGSYQEEIVRTDKLIAANEQLLDTTMKYNRARDIGATLEERAKEYEMVSAINDLYAKRIDLVQASTDAVMGRYDAEMSIFQERASRYADDDRYMAAYIDNMGKELEYHRKKLEYLTRILQTEQLTYEARLSLLSTREKEISAVKQLKDQIRGMTERDYVTQALGALRGMEYRAPGAGGVGLWRGGQVMGGPHYINASFVIEDRRDLATMLNDHVLPALDRRIHAESETTPKLNGPYF
jgi:hypothetical protein